jgi:hypothetical protein
VSEVFVPYADLPAHGINPPCRVHLTRQVRSGLFPAPVQISANRIAWRLSDLEQRKASRPIAKSSLPREGRGKGGRPRGSRVINGKLFGPDQLAAMSKAEAGEKPEPAGTGCDRPAPRPRVLPVAEAADAATE